MTKYIYILFFVCISQNVHAQDTINERYSLGYNYCLFGEVIATDSLYYVKGIVTNSVSDVDNNDAFIGFDSTGTPQIIKTIVNDSLGFDSWENHNFIKTLDGNFVQLIRMLGLPYGGCMFIKYSPSGDTIKTVLIDSLVAQTAYIVTNFVGLVQNKDSTFQGIIYVNNPSITYLGYVFYKLNKNGDLLFFNTYFPPPPFNGGLLSDYVKYNDTLSIMAYTTNYNGNTYRKLVLLDTMLNVIQTKSIYHDTLKEPLINDLQKTSDGGLLYCGALGDVLEEGPFPEQYPTIFKANITKLDSNFNLEWRLSLTDFIGEIEFDHFSEMKAVNDSEYVAVGVIKTSIYTDTLIDFTKSGWLVKFNLRGEVLWERKYIKVPHYAGEYGWAQHYLYDIDITKDSGFVMVGQSINIYHNNPQPYGQLGWLVKTDKYGCLVPGCQMYDNPTEPIDSTDTTSIITPPENVLYPNPANTTLYFYNTYSKDEPIATKTCYIYNLQGQIVQQFTVSDDKVTYIIDVSQLAASTYVFKVISSTGQVVRTSRFVVVH